jgi:NAD-dependent deacetylase
MHKRLAAAAALLRDAQAVACLTGAGVSAESGVATFRDAATGLWSKFDPQQLASQAGFAADPGLVWRWYMDRLQKISSVQPNPGHIALAKLAARFAQFDLITQNIDDLHERGGSPTVYHLHGSITRYRCNRCAAPYTLQPQDITAQTPPVCPRCRGPIRPDIVWFGEMLPHHEMEEAWRAARECEMMLVVGTSGIVYPAAQLPQLALQHGATIIEINPDPTPLTPIAGVALQAPSGEALPALLELLDAG